MPKTAKDEIHPLTIAQNVTDIMTLASSLHDEGDSMFLKSLAVRVMHKQESFADHLLVLGVLQVVEELDRRFDQ